MWRFVIYRLDQAVIMAVAGLGKRPEPLQISCGLELEVACCYICHLPYQVKPFLYPRVADPKKFLGEEYMLRTVLTGTSDGLHLPQSTKQNCFKPIMQINYLTGWEAKTQHWLLIWWTKRLNNAVKGTETFQLPSLSAILSLLAHTQAGPFQGLQQLSAAFEKIRINVQIWWIPLSGNSWETFLCVTVWAWTVLCLPTSE